MRAQSMLPLFPRLAFTLSDDRLDVMAEVPGVDAKDLEITLDESTLKIRGTRREERESHTKNCDRTERYHTPFERRIRLQGAIDPEKVGANLKNGLLHVRLPIAKNGSSVSGRTQVRIATP